MTLKEKFEDGGYLVFRQLLDEVDVQTIEDHVDSIYGPWKHKHAQDIFDYKMVNMHSLTLAEYFKNEEQRIRFFNAISTKKLIDVLQNLFGSNLYFHNTQLFFNPTNAEKLPYWHRDMQYSQLSESQQQAALSDMLSLHVRIPLEDEIGIAVIPGSHKRWDTPLEREVRFEINGHQNSEVLPCEKLIELKRGDVLMFSSNMIHRGHYCASASRKAFDLCVGTYHPYTSCFLDPRVLPTEQELAKIENNQWYKLAHQVFFSMNITKK